ncbi:MAG: phosphate-selective porin, partial [Myxococcaceae bacterium]|nr:phosphate-selective porin [Myxococcaceae bacterium]
MGAFRRFRSGLAAAASVLAFAAPAASAEPAERVPEPGLEVTRDITVSGYLQTEYQSHQDSEDQLRQGHVALNQNRFLLRRTRLRASGDWGYAAGVVELDANTIQGPLVGVRIAEGSLVYR